MRFDRLDWRIVRELFHWGSSTFPVGPLRVSLQGIASQVGVHRNTILARVRAMRKAGVLEGQVFEPRPGTVGLVRSGYLLHGTPSRDGEELLEALRRFPCISAFVQCRGVAFVHLWHDPGDSPKAAAQAVRQALGARSLIEGYVSTKFTAEENGMSRPSPFEVRMMLALRRAPTLPMSAVARELGVTTRTAERRAAALIERGAGAMVPLFRPGRVEGWILVHYVPLERDERAAAGLVRAFPDRVVGPFSPRQIPTVLVPLESLSEVERRRREAERVPGVGPLMPVLVQDITYPRAFEGWLAPRVESAQVRVASLQVHDA